jgi:hypothetical protein
MACSLHVNSLWSESGIRTQFGELSVSSEKALGPDFCVSDIAPGFVDIYPACVDTTRRR